jgi:hypothetical protein
MKKLRQATVEPVPGTLFNFICIRRIWTRGFRNANKFMLGAAVAYNLKKWLNYGECKTKTAIMALKKTADGLYFDLLCYCTSPCRKVQNLHSNLHISKKQNRLQTPAVLFL